MEAYLSTRPTSFPSVAAAIEWHVRSRTIRNSTSARASVPCLLRDSHHVTTSGQQQWIWRTDLSATKSFWENWFVGLSNKFLEARGGRLLLLAGTDRLDKELMIGQMQGLSSPWPHPFLSFFHIQRRTLTMTADRSNFECLSRNTNMSTPLPPQANTSSPSSPTPAISCTKTSPPRRRWSSPTSTGEMIGARLCCRPK